jgi:predicted nucleic acid-binding protein
VTKVFLDTAFVVALINQRDQYHEQALQLADEQEGRPLLTTDAVLLEIGNALARGYKKEAVEVIEYFLAAEDVEIVRLSPELFNDAFELYRARQDKEWGMVDCISFIVMRRAEATEALTCDGHFAQAGFRVLLDAPL